MVPIKQQIANKANYGNKRNTNTIKYIVIHYTANDGDHDESNGKYFQNNIVKASAHYFVDSDSITQSVPDDYVAYSVGGNKYGDIATTGGGKLYGKCTNSNSISIELCDDQKNGTIYPSTATIRNALELTRLLMSKYNVSIGNVIRHFDVTGKYCPVYWMDNTKWEKEFHGLLGTTLPKVETTQEAKEKPFQVRIITNELNVRKGAGVTYGIVEAVHKGQIFTIVEEKKGWGKLKSGKGWINISSKYVARI